MGRMRRYFDGIKSCKSAEKEFYQQWFVHSSGRGGAGEIRKIARIEFGVLSKIIQMMNRCANGCYPVEKHCAP
jgi:hypothetical protein